MNTQNFRSHYRSLVLVLFLGACSGGNIGVTVEGPIIPPIPPVSTSEAITAHGVITGLGDVTVNDVRYATNAASRYRQRSTGHPG